MYSIIFLILSSIINASMDIISHKWNQSIFSYIKNESYIRFSNPNISWKNKWKNDDPKYGEKFFLSSSMFVMFTDLWHLFKFNYLVLLILSIVSYNNITQHLIFDVLIFYIIYTIFFELFYNKILTKKLYS